MRILVISDIHANLPALESVLAEAGEVDATWCLGDLVGYGPNPNECVQIVSQLPNLQCILGNHDAAVMNTIDSTAFNQEAREAILWTQTTLSDGSWTFIKHLPESIVIDDVTLAHGSPRQPVWEYLLDSYSATRNFEFFDTSYCFIGHTHLPVIFHLADGYHMAKFLIPETHKYIELEPRAIINPGSVGQPRDRDPRAAYALFDSEKKTWEYRRVAYNVTDVQKSMEDVGLPNRHIQRLSVGW